MEAMFQKNEMVDVSCQMKVIHEMEMSNGVESGKWWLGFTDINTMNQTVFECLKQSHLGSRINFHCIFMALRLTTD